MLQKNILSIFVALSLLILIANGCSQETNTVGESLQPQGVEQVIKKGTSSEQDIVRVGDPEAGKPIYERYCFYCHGRQGLGDGAIGMALTPRPADFVNDLERMAKSDEELLVSISEGIEGIEDAPIVMPAWKTVLSEKERWDVLAYVRYLSEKGKKVNSQ
ncbi:MAG: c-type cytochrome [Thermodesulfobacteriota bacterium]